MSSQRLGSVDSVTIRNLNTDHTEDLRDLSVEALEARRSQRGRAATKKRRKNLCKAQTFSRLVVQKSHWLQRTVALKRRAFTAFPLTNRRHRNHAVPTLLN